MPKSKAEQRKSLEEKMVGFTCDEHQRQPSVLGANPNTPQQGHFEFNMNYCCPNLERKVATSLAG